MANPKAPKAPKAPKLKSFHFDCGNSTHGHIGFCARIRAATKNEALEILRRVLPTEMKVHPCGGDADNGRVEYIRAYISPDHVTLKEVDDGEDVEEDK